MNRYTLCLTIAGCLPTSLAGASSVVLNPNNVAFANVPTGNPYRALTNYRFEGRISGWAAPTQPYNRFLTHNNGSILINSSGAIVCLLDGSFGVGVSVTGRTDFLFRCERDVTNSRMSMEVWNPDGRNRVVNTAAIQNPAAQSWSGQLALGSFGVDATSRLSLGYLRWYAGVLPLDSPAPTNSPVAPDLASWEFERNTHDSAGKVSDFGSWTTGSPTYSTTPVYAPAANVSQPPLTVRAGESVILDASRSLSFADNPSLTYAWQQTSFVPLVDTSGQSAVDPAESAALGAVQWSSQSSAVVTATLPLAGTYYFRVTIADTAGQTDSTTFVIGSVATDSKGIVIVPDPKMRFLLGPMTILGSSPWPWYDRVMKADADVLFSAQGIPSAPPFQPTASGSAGTISVTNAGEASKTITGTGTRFTTDFACNNTDSIVIYYRLTNAAGQLSGRTGARVYTVVSCTSDTQMTINQGGAGFNAGSPQTGLAYGKLNDDQAGGWINGSTNWNYYDVVLAMYRLYYRSGIDTYLTNARRLADMWYVYPLDGGRAYNSGAHTPSGARSAGVLGMMARALDGRPEMWLDEKAAGAPAGIPGVASAAGIKGMVDTLKYLFADFARYPDPGDIGDGRETGYSAWYYAAYAYLYDPGYYAAARDMFLGTNSIRSRYQPGFAFTTNANVLTAPGLTRFGYSGPNNQGSLWLNVFVQKAIAAFAETATVPADAAAASALLKSSFDDFMASHYMGGSCQEITYSSFYKSCASAQMPIDAFAPVQPTGTVSATNGSNVISGSGTNFLNTSVFRNDGSDYIGIRYPSTDGFQMMNIRAGGISSATSLQVDPATPFLGTTGSGLTYGRAAACPDGTGRGANYPQNTYSTLDANIAECDFPAHYGMGGRAVSELVHQINGYLYAKTGDEQYKTRGDAMFAAAYGCGTAALGCLRGGTGLADNITGGGPGADGGAGNFADLLVYPVSSNAGRGKNFGASAGTGMADTYLAYRQGGPEAVSSRTVQIGFDPAAVPSGGSVRVSVVQPTGLVSRTNCTASPCSVSLDTRQGNHLLKLDYLSAAGAVLAAGQAAVLKVR